MRLTQVLFLSLALTLFISPVEARLLEGVVRDRATRRPLEGVRVRVQASPTSVTTNADGRYSLETDRAGKVVVTAWREGYLNGGGEGKEILLEPIFEGDQKDYRWVSPDPPTILEWADILFWKAASFISRNEKIKSRFADNCSNCHGATTIREWRQDAHSQSAVNPIVLTLYNGTSLSGEPAVFPGYRLDFPKSFGNCAACHAPAAAVKNPWGTDLNAVEGTARHGVFCDVCHKVREVEIHPEGGFPGILSMRFHRPPQREQIFFGPLDDVIAGPDSFAALYRESRFCAPCHSARFWGVPIYSDYDEWLESPYAKGGKEGRTCQDCHMAPDKETTLIAPETKGGVRRPPETLATHRNPGSRDRDFLTKAIKMELSDRKSGRILEVTVRLTNVGAGHHFPTGVPMRNMILLVEARDVKGKVLDLLDGPVVPDWGGVGPVEDGNFSGLPGKGFAKILGDISKTFPRYSPDSRVPTPHWRQAVIVSDNRIPAKGSDLSRYRFHWGEREKGPVRVMAHLLYRRAFKSWIDAKGWPLEDLEIARAEQVVP